MSVRNCAPDTRPDTGPDTGPCRRDALLALGALALGGACASPDGDASPDADASAGSCTAAPAPGEAGWVEVPLSLHPALRVPGSGEAVRIPESLLDVILLHTVEGCFLATWRICPHGACTVDYFPDSRELRCPCHGSRFAEDGRLLQGPAARALVSFPATQVGDSVFIKRQV